MSLNLKANFAEDLQKLVGKKCWGIVEGKRTGSIISFMFGEKIPSQKPIENEFLSEDVQNFESEFSLFIECVWRIDSIMKVVIGAWTEHEIVHREINQIIGQNVKSFDLFEPAFDLKVIFANDLQLNIFCDQTNDVDNNNNYSFFTPEIIYTVGHKSILTTSKPD